MTATRPNILLIMADQLAAGWLPAYGHTVVHTPNITALAASGRPPRRRAGRPARPEPPR